MNSRSIPSILAVMLAVIAGIFVIVQVMTGHGNSLGLLARFICVGSFAFGAMNVRHGIYLMVIYAGYIDLLKRFMVLDYRFSFIDIAWMLSVPLALIAGMIVGKFLPSLLGMKRITRYEWVAFIFGCIVSIAALLGMLVTSRSLTGLQFAANIGAYSFLPFLLAGTFKGREDLYRLARFTMYAFLPAALYGIKQWVTGLSYFEIEYLKSGMTIQVKQLDDIAPRPFSTVANPGGFGAVCVMGFGLALLGVVGRWRAGSEFKALFPPLFILLVIASVYLTALLGTRVRSAWVAVPVFLIFWFFFQTGRRTVLIYSLVAMVVVTLISLADLMLEKRVLEKWSGILVDAMGGGEFANQAGRLQTFAERLKGYRDVLASPGDWPLFGSSDLVLGQDIQYHDQISAMIHTIGAIPALFLVIIAVALVAAAHRWLLKGSTKGKDRVFSTFFFAMSITLLLRGVFGGGGIRTYPINVLIFLGLAMVLASVVVTFSQRQNVVSRRTMGVGLGMERSTRSIRTGAPDGARG